MSICIGEKRSRAGDTLDTITLDNGVTLEYAETGRGLGKGVIFLHGYTDSWFSFSQVLAELPRGCHGLALTQRFHGDLGFLP
ncbi:MAG: alpha/beta hydrolase [Acidobacteriota bacterium]|nr:alpha/beta hydrolase [Acidobacteriota bacterium]